MRLRQRATTHNREVVTRVGTDPTKEVFQPHRHFTRLQHLVATALGVDEGKRMDTVVAMLANNARRVPGYWIQLFLSMGIATLGLVLDSTAVVIGAMLVSPLMGPILELGMGFAVGSSLLVLRASLRVLLSVALVVAGSALLVLALPFHEVTSEVAARVAPTALDLLIAVFCGLTAAYTTVRPGSDTTAAAAGTAIGIALVPPLCTVGFGLGTGAPSLAGGAALLFTANLSAILVLSVLSFLLLGFNQVIAGGVERDFLARDGTLTQRWAGAVHRVLGHVFGSRYGLAMRLLIPAVFLVAVFVPLRRALDEVTWEVRARDALRRIVQEESPRAMQTSLVVERHRLSVRLFVVGSSARAAALERRIIDRVTSATGVPPDVTIVAVPDESRMLAAAATEWRAHSTESEIAPALNVRRRASDALLAEWPSQAGRIVRWELTMSPSDSVTVLAYHVGEPLRTIGSAMLARALSLRLNVPVRVEDVPLPAARLAATPGQLPRWLDTTRTLLAVVARTDSAVACVRGPIGPKPRPTRGDKAIMASLQATEAGQIGRVTFTQAARWEVRVAVGSCVLGTGLTPKDTA